jgi:acyl carrier protein
VSRGEIEHRIKRVLRERLEIDLDRVTGRNGGALAGSGLGLDSIEALSLAVALEEEFGFNIDDEDLTAELFHSVGTIADYVTRRSSPSSPATRSDPDLQ